MSTQLELTGSDGTPWWWCPTCDAAYGDCACTDDRIPAWATGWVGPWVPHLTWTRRGRVFRAVEQVDTWGLT